MHQRTKRSRKKTALEAPNIDPRERPNTAPRGPQERPNIGHEAPKRAPTRPQYAREAPKKPQ
eukprot:537439-Pyramimonas_sp.AAC.1